jgi:hypothetical protein
MLDFARRLASFADKQGATYQLPSPVASLPVTYFSCTRIEDVLGPRRQSLRTAAVFIRCGASIRYLFAGETSAWSAMRQ